MKPLSAKTEDTESLETLGRASLQVVHDLKNQLNGLKLYATFLRTRWEKSERPPDERETINKLIEGLDRSADDLSILVQYGRTLELTKQPGIDLQKVAKSVLANLGSGSRATAPLASLLSIETDGTPLIGEFDQALIAEGLKSISIGACRMHQGEPVRMKLSREANADGLSALIEWQSMKPFNHDPFRSFAGSNELRMSLAAKTIESHGGSAICEDGTLRVKLPLK
jgi:light-regulated signal transduction histidine kinase (bacteriophytochrome)